VVSLEQFFPPRYWNTSLAKRTRRTIWTWAEYIRNAPTQTLLNRLLAVDVLLRHELDEEEDEEEDEGDSKEEDDEGNSDLNPPPPLHVLAGAWATKCQVVLKPRVSAAESEGRQPGRKQPRLVPRQTRCCESIDETAMGWPCIEAACRFSKSRHPRIDTTLTQ
jgi:hypothetical protein